MKKRIFSVCLVLVLLAGLLAGCGKQDDVQTPGNDGADGTGTETITLNWVSDGGWAQNEKPTRFLKSGMPSIPKSRSTALRSVPRSTTPIWPILIP